MNQDSSKACKKPTKMFSAKVRAVLKESNCKLPSDQQKKTEMMCRIFNPREKVNFKFGNFTVPSQCDEKDVEFVVGGVEERATFPTGMSQTLFDLFLTR
ncbi:hypothetical protein ACHWQZ_G000932 [Mnemiopsis leidyi]